ncbi:hypothetical protein DASC09_050920 [Saccharomycopsis crataegensis]|uniref:Uncharacterized protein n=1 Tax=Saccharomycopsis crataegensis TaxID=43959 RepID=A0AAV5QSB0_9ASCO|nr:hypothetical protein DASC09_050920 [Saccharomycopsis crataegensis]
MSAWRKAGFSFNKYVAISSQTLRSVLKEDLKVVAEKRNDAEVRFVKFNAGEQQGEPTLLSLSK